MQHANNDNKILDSLSDVSVEKADLPILPLVKRFFQNNNMRAQAARSDIVFIARHSSENNAIIAALRLCPVDNSWLLRSMCVASKYQRKGIGQHMLKQIQHELQCRPVYCFAYTHLQDFYQRAGFSSITTDDAAESISKKFQQYCSQKNNILLMRHTGI